MKGMKRKFFLKRMWNFVVVMLIPALLLVAVTTYMTFVTQMHRMTQDNERGIEAVRSNISLVLDSVLAQNSYMTGMTRTNMVLNKALKRESLSYTDAIYLRSLVSSLNSMTNAYDYVDSVLIYMDGYDRALTSSGLVNLSADGLQRLVQRVFLYVGYRAHLHCPGGGERRQSQREKAAGSVRPDDDDGRLCGRYPEHQPLAGNDCRAAPVR